MNEWEKFYSQLYYEPKQIQTDSDGDTLNINRLSDPDLDSFITKDELISAIISTKSSSAPGPDTIGYDFYKNLPLEGTEHLLRFFNEIIKKEETPSDWSKINTILLYKKGDKNDLNNYRGISLLNCIAKIFTTVLNNRLRTWTEKHNLLPDSQSGFRKGRSCSDNIFILNSIIQSHIRLPKRKLYIAFIDFKKAFDSVVHALLFQKLKKLNVSTKFINILNSIYEQAKTKIRYNSEESDEIPILKSVLQGEILSPSLFNLFLSDVVDFFKERGYEGVSIDGTTNLAILAYADDLTIIAESVVQMNKALNILEEYCQVNGLNVNIDKTKILIVSKGKLSDKRPKCYYKNQVVEEVLNFNYLGVCFSRKGVFEEAAKQAVIRSRSASGIVRQTLARASNSCFQAAKQVYNASVLGTMLHGSLVWSLRYIDMLESAQNYFFKNYFSLQANAPHYIVRQEFDLKYVATKIIRQILNFINKIHDLEDGNLLKRCFDRLLYLDSLKNSNIKYNWISQVKQLLSRSKVDIERVFSSSFDKAFINNIITNYSTILQQQDVQKIQNSTYSSLYRVLNCFNFDDTTYLHTNQNNSFTTQRLLAQLRTAGLDIIKLKTSSNIHIIRTNEICTVCNKNEPETLAHIFLRCPIYQPQRKAFLPLHVCSEEWEDNTNVASILGTGSLSKHQASNIYYFIINVMKVRSFIINE